ncbi:uncharacterized protein GGS22DRAFT_174221 [Annulohypoxylon maeteangense]|uniref:uncharacterized protein n=1 Tax=Annulohypoxylon maeteangense TaxID=1927788 RepID=UPI0020085995|nr:uncharacterized protein GGS22DRAFT_174221 [Annulohypoxylon maeteangense]KAI0880787.1 hypothetical protein GGS22DRAFT_174221 [Annulohypoxylon maeteangense]
MLFHHVLQLQCIADPLPIFCGWSITGLEGHVLNTPAQIFRHKRNVNLSGPEWISRRDRPSVPGIQSGRYTSRLTENPPSHFPGINLNGLREYSPSYAHRA